MTWSSRRGAGVALPHDDRAGHQLAVDGAVVLVSAWLGKRDRVRPAPGHRAATREAGRADGLDAVRQRPGPGPRGGATDGDGVDSRIRAPVVAAHELDAGADRHRTPRAASPAASSTVPTSTPPPAPTPAVHARAAVTAATCQR